MKTTTPLKAAIAFACLLILNACSKNTMHPASSENPISKEIQADTIEYRISPVPGYLASIIYSDSAGNQVTVYDPNEFKDGLKKVIATKKPYDAFFSTKIFNVSGEVLNFKMIISVNGEIKENINCSVDSHWPNPGSTNTIEYEVQ